VASLGSAAPANPGDLEAEVARLQGILDDPRKLDEYFAQKAMNDYQAASVVSIALDGVPTKGKAQGPIHIVEYSDFLCPFCRNLAGALQSFIGQSGNRIRVFYKNYPLEQECNPNVQRTAHPGACLLARAAICAQDQGKFWPYHDRVFGQPLENPKSEDVVRLGGEAGLDTGALAACMGSAGTRERLAAQIAEAKRVGVQATPTLFINGKKLPRINDFVQVVDKAAQAKGLPPLQENAHAPNH
jgi:protein-disulfide isomerase